MAYYRQEEVRRLIENCMAWVGDGVVHGPRGCIVLRALNSIRREHAPTRLPSVLGIEAGHAQAALQRMPTKLRYALVVFHTSDLTFALQARARVGVSKDTYHRRLVEAHPVFLEAFEDEVGRAKGRAMATAAAMAAAQ
jgi:hypothetical protein